MYNSTHFDKTDTIQFLLYLLLAIITSLSKCLKLNYIFLHIQHAPIFCSLIIDHFSKPAIDASDSTDIP